MFSFHSLRIISYQNISVMKMKRRRVEDQNRHEENVKRKIWTMNNELKPKKLAIKVFIICIYIAILN